MFGGFNNSIPMTISYHPHTTLLNDMAFTDYHFFHAQSRILDGFTPVSPAQ